MSSDEYIWTINLVRDRNQYLNLTFEQTEQILQYEQEKHVTTDSFLSVWEELDYEWHVYSGILDDGQLKSYEERRNGIIERHVEDLKDHDQLEVVELAKTRDSLQFYEEVLLPPFFSDPHFQFLGRPSGEKIKIDFLRAEYQKFLSDEKIRIVSDHFRHYRTYKPRALEASLLRHKLHGIWPDFMSFIYKMDEPTKAVFKFLQHKIGISLQEKKAFFDERLKTLESFKEANLKKHYPDIDGWFAMKRILPASEEQEQRAMLWLLLKKDGYAC